MKLLRKALCLSFVILSALKALAVEEPYVNELRGPQVAVNNLFYVSDEKFNNGTEWNKIRQNIRVDNMITFEINFDTSVYFYNTPFWCTVNFKIYIYGNQIDTSEVTDSTTHANIPLTVNYVTTAGQPYKGIAMYKFTGAHKYKVKILSMTSNLGPIPPIFRLKGQIIVKRQYKFQDASTDIINYEKLTDDSSSRLKLQWVPTNYPGAEMFDVEYTFIDSSSQIGDRIRSYNIGSAGYYYVDVDTLAKWFTNNATRITTASSNYLINIPYDSGYVLFRIRGVQDSLGIRIEGSWNYSATDALLGCTSSCPKGVVFFAGHEVNLNWQYSIVFAEEGKRKEVISYFDGSLRNRQSVTINNSDNKNIVQETIYDALGRPSASILPAPANDSTIHYFDAFNRNSGGTDPYSFSDLSVANCVTTPDSLSYQYGTGKYYSTANGFLNSYYYARYIPNAGGYPLAVTEYMADNTGRIKMQSGVGPAFQPGANHETKYFYGKPTQTELDRLFGLEAGNASHYLKNMVVDANGQISVSYLDAGGKTIATALAAGAPPNMHELPTASGASVQVTNEIIQPTDFEKNATNGTFSASTTFLAPVTGTYVFDYRVDSLTYRKLYGANKDSSICSHCYYDLEIIIRNDCADTLRRDTVSAGAVFDTACATPPASIKDSIHVSIPQVGEYYVSFNLLVSRDALDYYDSVHLVKNTDIKKLNYFLIDELKNTDFYGCYNECHSCFDKLGTKTDFVGLFKSMYLADSVNFLEEDSLLVVEIYDSLYSNCWSLQAQCGVNVCDEKLELLKMDVRPGGQYALYDTTDNSLLEVPINVLAMRSSITKFKDENGNVPDSVMIYGVGGEDSVKLDVTELSDSLFIARFKDSWADSLVKLHPEYCFYLWCSANQESYEFDKTIESWDNSDTAMARGWFYPPVYDTILAHDPFFLVGGKGYAMRNKMRDSLKYFSRTLVGYAQSDKNILRFIDLVLYCKNSKSCTIWDDCDPDDDCRSRGREWQLYRTYYLNLKQLFYERARRTDSDPTFSNCTNCFIGKDLGDESDIICNPPSLSNFQFIGNDLGGISILYTGKPLRHRIGVVWNRNEGGGGIYTDTAFFNRGQRIVMISFEVKFLAWISEIYCDTASSWTPFVDTLCVNNNCDPGVFNPYDRDSILFYVEFGNPDIAPSSVPSGFAGCRFYKEFVVHTGASTICRFTNVWVCIKDSTCPGHTGVCPEAGYDSHCTAGANDSLYKLKVRRYPEYVDPSRLMEELDGINPQDESKATEDLIIETCKENCEAMADLWINQLKRCVDEPTLTTLKEALIDICSKACSMDLPYGASSIPGSISATYHSFEEAISAIVPGAYNDSCTQELLSQPYPYDRQPVYLARQISESDSAICARLDELDTEYQGSGYGGSFHSWLKLTYGNSYTLDSLELVDLINSCKSCNYILKNDIILPLLLDPHSRGCLVCDSVSDALDDFETKFPSLDPSNDDYEIIFTNYFNHRFGFSLSFGQYRDYLDSCIAHSGDYDPVLCNEQMQEEIEPDLNACTRALFANALNNAVSIYRMYIDSVRQDFREAWMTKCMNAQPTLSMTADLYEYHYTLYYYDQSGNLVKTVPPKGVVLLDNTDIAAVQAIRAGANPACSNNNSMVFTNGSVNFKGGTDAPQLSVGTGPFTIECWIKLSSYSDQGIISNNHYVSSFFFPHDYGYALDLIGGKLNLALAEASASDKLEAESPAISSFIPLNTWSHLVVQRVNTTTVRMYVNGNPLPVSYPVFSPNTGNVDHTGTDPFYTGASLRFNSLTKLSSGKMRHLRVYKRALPAKEVRQNYNDACGNPSSYHSLVFWETFTEGLFTSSGGNDYVHERIYDSSGQKSGTVAFETAGSITLVPEHTLVTTYKYNSLNQVLQQYSPDGDTSNFYYERLGRLIASQNKEQKENSSYSGSAMRYSYTLYDSLGRIKEVGEKSEADPIGTIDLLDTTDVRVWLESGTDRQVTKTIYDNPINTNWQDYNTSRKRVVASVYLENKSDGEGDSTLYNYDILGNVKTLMQHVKELVAVDATNGKKRIDYDYDLVSGKVNLVSYQHGKGDQFYYKYSYDADNRVIKSYSSRDKLLWIEDASYLYYLHGPLARTELGKYKVQGVDYAYTLQGWLKGINSDVTDPITDMAQDGSTGSPYERVSRDVYDMKLGYYANDYTQISNDINAFGNMNYSHPGSLDLTGNPLYNGNISYINLSLSKIDHDPWAYTYGYDQLNRLVEMRAHNIPRVGDWANDTYSNKYKETITYDPNGNILTYLRNGNDNDDPPSMDEMSYNYYSNNNKLDYVTDAVTAGKYAVDIDDQSSGNYVYDLMGNLKKDVAESIDTIRWTVYGKINRIVRLSADTAINYKYDPSGNRTYKALIDGVNKLVFKTFYIRDAQGNVLAVYSQSKADPVFWKEQHLYGSSRLGMWNPDTTIAANPPTVNGSPIYDSLMIGSRSYELTNHLGNLLSVISDKKIGIENSGVVDFYTAEVLSQNDYYPFGMLMPGRQYKVDGYRYGFNGKENDDEVKGEGNQQDYGMRIYDPRLGRFLSVDPLTRSYPMLTPYQYASNNPIENIDLDGQEGTRHKIQIGGYTLLEVINLKVYVNVTNIASYANGIFAGTAYENKMAIVNELHSYLNDSYNDGKDMYQSMMNPITVNEIGDPVYYNFEVIPIESATNTDYVTHKDRIINDERRYFEDTKSVGGRSYGDDFTFLLLNKPKKGVAEFRGNEVNLDPIRYADRAKTPADLTEFKEDIAHEVGHKLLSRHPDNNVNMSKNGDSELLHNLLGGFMNYGHIIRLTSGGVLKIMWPTEKISQIMTTRVLESVIKVPNLNIKITPISEKPQ